MKSRTIQIFHEKAFNGYNELFWNTPVIDTEGFREVEILFSKPVGGGGIFQSWTGSAWAPINAYVECYGAANNNDNTTWSIITKPSGTPAEPQLDGDDGNDTFTRFIRQDLPRFIKLRVCIASAASTNIAATYSLSCILNSENTY